MNCSRITNLIPGFTNMQDFNFPSTFPMDEGSLLCLPCKLLQIFARLSWLFVNCRDKSCITDIAAEKSLHIFT